MLALKQENVLKTEDLLKVKGAGFFSKWFKKVLKIFKKVLKKLAKVLKKIAAVINKVLTTVFGKTIGGMLSSIINMPINFMATSMDLIAEGNFKGLLKHIGKMLIQVIIQVVIAVLTYFTMGALTIALGGLLNALGGALMGLGQAIAGFGSALGGVIGGIVNAAAQVVGFAVQAVGFVVQQAGALLKSIGKSLIQKGLKMLRNPLGQFTESIQQIVNPIASLQNIASSAGNLFTGLQAGFDGLVQGFTKGFNTLTTQMFKPLIDEVITYGTKLANIFANKKLDKQLQKKQMNWFLETLIRSTVNSGISALGDAVTVTTYNTLGIEPDPNKQAWINLTENAEARVRARVQAEAIARAQQVSANVRSEVREGEIQETDNAGKVQKVVGNLSEGEMLGKPRSEVRSSLTDDQIEAIKDQGGLILGSATGDFTPATGQHSPSAFERILAGINRFGDNAIVQQGLNFAGELDKFKTKVLAGINVQRFTQKIQEISVQRFGKNNVIAYREIQTEGLRVTPRFKSIARLAKGTQVAQFLDNVFSITKIATRFKHESLDTDLKKSVQLSADIGDVLLTRAVGSFSATGAYATTVAAYEAFPLPGSGIVGVATGAPYLAAVGANAKASSFAQEYITKLKSIAFDYFDIGLSPEI